MGLSKTNRMLILLVIDIAFFLLELIVGYAVHSLALVADSFHMLNDVISLLVGLWAVKVANRETTSKMYTYGWQRAETLGALVNGVFLVALCMSIFLEAIQRLVEPQEVKNPKLVLIVGSLGLLSNILGLVLFHDHSHGHSHSHGEAHEEIEEADAAEQGYSTHQHTDTVTMNKRKVVVNSNSPVAAEQSSPYSRRRRTIDSQHRGSRSFVNVEDIQVHPATLRQEIIAASRNRFVEDELSSDSESDQQHSERGIEPSERSSLLQHTDRSRNYGEGGGTIIRDSAERTADEDLHKFHNHAQAKSKSQHGHGHDLNMRGVFLHVVGDALGNIGVIASALLIWLTDYSWRFDFDPGISLIITFIILASAIPLCTAASRILLQAVPPGMSIDHIKEDIERLPGVMGSHHLHVWQLSDTKIVASIHIQVDTEIKGEGSERYMLLARQVRKCLHAYGIHSSTIQPEFAPESDAEDSTAVVSDSRGGSVTPSASNNVPNRTDSIRDGATQACLLECGEECAQRGQCCPQKST